jgi:hypothetical protein
MMLTRNVLAFVAHASSAVAFTPSSAIRVSSALVAADVSPEAERTLFSDSALAAYVSPEAERTLFSNSLNQNNAHFELHQ